MEKEQKAESESSFISSLRPSRINTNCVSHTAISPDTLILRATNPIRWRFYMRLRKRRIFSIDINL